MKILKFGGASVKDAEGIQNVYNVLKTIKANEVLVVVSAMGKTTNALEVVVKNYFDRSEELQSSVQSVKEYHFEIISNLFKPTHLVFSEVENYFFDLNRFLEQNKSPNYSFVYDQVVSFGEMISSKILYHYLKDNCFDLTWLDSRNFIKTDNSYRDANVNWEQTEKQISEHINKTQNYITQGFLGSDENNFTTTLGREGSDYTAAIFAYSLDAENVTIWKDVAGVLNADPRFFENTTLLEQISYREAIELAFYGASIIHPKTLQPLQQKEIPFFVKSFLNPLEKGTSISKGVDLHPKLPCFIVKKPQHLISFSSKDFSFIMEENISFIFSVLHKYKIKVHLIQNSAISFSVCIEDKFLNLNKLINELSDRFNISYHENVSLYTIRHFDEKAITSVANGKKLLIKQTSKETVQMVVA
ncbi:MAG: aspartate kinase [Flavobacteriaceae bacterium]